MRRGGRGKWRMKKRERERKHEGKKERKRKVIKYLRGRKRRKRKKRSSRKSPRTLNLMRSSTISRFSLSMAIRRAERPRGSTQLMLMNPVSAALMRILRGRRQVSTGEKEITKGKVKLMRIR